MINNPINNKYEIIICTESGYLESLSKLLIFSVRQFDGPLKNVAIHSYSPRESHRPNKATIRFFEEHQVIYEDRNLNTEFLKYPLANKPIVCADREQKTNAEYLIFLDSDMFFLNPPTLFETISNQNLFMRPVDEKGIGSSKDFTGLHGSYWKELYRLLNVGERHTIRTTTENQEILEYYNSGKVISRSNTGLFQAWEKNFHKVMKLGLSPKSGISFVEQSVLSATISSLGNVVERLPKEYNCPAFVLDRTSNKDYQLKSFNEIVSLHYHKIFVNKSKNNPIHSELQQTEKGRVINQKIVEFSIIRKMRSQNSFKEMLKRLLGYSRQ